MIITCANSFAYSYVNMRDFVNVHGLLTSPVLTVNNIVSYNIPASDIVTTMYCHTMSSFLKSYF